jgi:hypothetical protein
MLRDLVFLMLVPRIEKLRPTELFRLIKKHKELPPIFGKAKVREFDNRKNYCPNFLDWQELYWIAKFITIETAGFLEWPIHMN